MSPEEIKREQIRVLYGALDRVKTSPCEYMCQSICDAYEPGTSYAASCWGGVDALVLAPITERIKAAIDHRYTVEEYLARTEPNLEDDTELFKDRALEFRINFLTNLIAEYEAML